jgi:hypothetical protein
LHCARRPRSDFKSIVTPSLVERGGRLTVELTPLSPALLSNQIIADVTEILTLRCAVVSRPKALTSYQAAEVRARVLQGETRESVARAYGIALDQIPTRQQLAAQ